MTEGERMPLEEQYLSNCYLFRVCYSLTMTTDFLKSGKCLLIHLFNMNNYQLNGHQSCLLVLLPSVKSSSPVFLPSAGRRRGEEEKNLLKPLS